MKPDHCKSSILNVDFANLLIMGKYSPFYEEIFPMTGRSWIFMMGEVAYVSENGVTYPGKNKQL